MMYIYRQRRTFVNPSNARKLSKTPYYDRECISAYVYAESRIESTGTHRDWRWVPLWVHGTHRRGGIQAAPQLPTTTDGLQTGLRRPPKAGLSTQRRGRGGDVTPAPPVTLETGSRIAPRTVRRPEQLLLTHEPRCYYGHTRAGLASTNAAGKTSAAWLRYISTQAALVERR